MLKKYLLILSLLYTVFAYANEPRAFYEFMYGKSAYEDNNNTMFGMGARFTFPVSDDFYFGFKGDFNYYTEGQTGLITHLAFSADWRIKDDLYLTGDYGHAWAYNNVEDENGTVVGTSELPASHGEYHTVGLRLQFSDYVEAAVLYRNTLFTPMVSLENFREEELIFTLNLAITRESWEFFRWLSELDNRRH